jgi:DNA-binding PadR family transcriptional regulator
MDRDHTSASASLTDWVVLGVIVEGDRHGFAVARELATDGPLGQVWTVRRPLVYRAIDHLLALEWIEPTRIEHGSQGPQRVVMRATRRGSGRLAKWLELAVEHPRDVRSELLVKFTLLARRGQPLAPLARRQLDAFATRFDAMATRDLDPESPEWPMNLWRAESSRAIERTLQAIAAAQ